MEIEIKIVKELKRRGWRIGVMESCTGGAIINSITNIPGVSVVFKGGVVVYSNEAKVNAGVSEKIIEKHGVYSKEVAIDMALKINGDVGIGVTGELPGMVFVAVRIKDQIVNLELKMIDTDLNKIKSRVEMKSRVADKVMKTLMLNLKES